MADISTQYANNILTATVNSPLQIGGNTINVIDDTGFPTITGSQYFYMTLSAVSGPGVWEVVKVTVHSPGSHVITVDRAQDNTTELEWPAGSNISMRDNAAIFDDISTAVATKADVAYVDTTTVALDGSRAMTGGLIISNTAPELTLLETGVTADNGRWDMYANAEKLSIRAVNDANTVAGTALSIERTGTVIDSIALNAPSVTTTGAIFQTVAQADNTFSNILVDTGNNNNLRVMTNPLASAYNSAINLDDIATIFHAGSSGTGRYTLAGWNVTKFGYSLDNTTETHEFAGTVTGDTAPTADDHLTRKDYVDALVAAVPTGGDFLADGSVPMTGDLFIGDGTNTANRITVQGNTGGDVHLTFRDDTGATRSRYQFDPVTSEATLDLRNTSSVLLTELTLKTNGNVELTTGAAVPLAAGDLARKDYVDAVAAAKPVLLDTPINILFNVSTSTVAWTAITDAVLSTNNATSVTLQLINEMTGGAAGVQRISIKKTGVASHAAHIRSGVNTSATTDTGADSTEVTVGLDASHQFDYTVTRTGAISTSAVTINIIGYYV